MISSPDLPNFIIEPTKISHIFRKIKCIKKFLQNIINKSWSSSKYFSKKKKSEFFNIYTLSSIRYGTATAAIITLAAN
jgi:hypothetical protein